jgi:outer membrane protein OmpA-like peptidoglycan-associated protein
MVSAIKKSKKWSSIIINGHADSTGPASFNQTLSEKRSLAVKNYFASKGIDVKSMTSIGQGETKPISTNKTAAGRAKNRRVEFRMPK